MPDPMTGGPAMIEARICDLFVLCSMPRVPGRFLAASDCCGSLAVSGAFDPALPEGERVAWNRCPAHEGLLPDGRKGAVVTTRLIRASTGPWPPATSRPRDAHGRWTAA